MGFFDFLGSGGYSPVTGGIGSDYASDPANDPNRSLSYPDAMYLRSRGGSLGSAPADNSGGGIGSDYARSQADDQPSTFSKILSSIGLTPDALGVLATGQPTQPPIPPPRVGGIGSDFASSGGLQPGVPMPQPNPLTGPSGGTAQIAAAPGAIVRPGGVGGDINVPTMVRGGAGNAPIPTFGIPGGQAGAAPAPLPPGAGAPMNIVPQGAQGGAQQPQGFLKNLITGGRPSGSLGLQQMMAGLGKGAANIQGNGRFASFARGLGGGIEGAQEQQKVQMNQATQDFNNTMKLMLAGSTLQRNAAQAQLAQQRGRYLQLGGGKQGDSWRASPYGRQNAVDTEAEKNYRAGLTAILKDPTMSQEQRTAAVQVLKTEREKERMEGYKRYGIDPVKGAPGSSATNPINVSQEIKSKYIPGKDLSEQSPEFQKEFNMKVPAGASFSLPDDQPGHVHWQSPSAAMPSNEERAAKLSATAPRWDELNQPNETG